MVDVRVADGASDMRAADGRVPGRRGRATRRRLLEATHELLDEIAYRDLKVIEVSRRAGTSPATFYQYFADIPSAVLVLADEVVTLGAERLRSLVDESDWDDRTAATALVRGFVEFFDGERALLRVVDLAALEGDERFRALRSRLLDGVLLALQDVVRQAGAAGEVDAGTDPAAVAAILAAMLAHVAAHRRGLEFWRATQDELDTAMAEIIDRSVRGSRRR